MTRNRFCELIAIELQLGEDALDYFLVELFSLADALFGVPLEAALEHVALPPDLERSIREELDEPGLLLRASRAAERGDPLAVAETADLLGVTVELIQSVYLKAARWAMESA